MAGAGHPSRARRARSGGPAVVSTTTIDGARARAASRRRNAQLASLDLSRALSGLGARGAAALGDALGANVSLRTLDVGSNRLSAACAKPLLDALGAKNGTASSRAMTPPSLRLRRRRRRA